MIGIARDTLSGETITLIEGENVFIGGDKFASLGTLDSLDRDLLRVAAYIYAADLAVKRHERERHIRSIAVTIPVANLQAFQRIEDQLENALSILSCDNWDLSFSAQMDVAPAANRSWPRREGAVLLFSGGLDSFAGAAHILEQEKRLTLVSHVTHNHTFETAQSQLAEAVRTHFSVSLPHIQVRVFGRSHGELRFPSDEQREETQRTRSFLFTAIAGVAARLIGTRRVLVMAENGQFAIHLPLSEARVGSFSTHTAHPAFLRQMEAILRQLYLCDDLLLSNPFVHLTKGEVIAKIPPELRNWVPLSTSCWRASRVSDYNHCGECVPCLCRRVALEVNGIKLKEYGRDLLRQNIGKLRPDDLGKRNLMDLAQFCALFEGRSSIPEEEICFHFPELITSEFERAPVIAMYRRAAKETFAVLSRYKGVTDLIK